MVGMACLLIKGTVSRSTPSPYSAKAEFPSPMRERGPIRIYLRPGLDKTQRYAYDAFTHHTNLGRFCVKALILAADPHLA